MAGWSQRDSNKSLVVVLLAALLSTTTGLETISDRLLREVWSTYEQDVRPICGTYPSPVHASLGIGMRQLVEINEPKRRLSASIWFRMSWSDCRLTWNTSDYDGIQRVVVPKQRMWVPDLTLYDNADPKLGEQDEYWVIINHDGVVRYQLPAIVRSICKLNVAKFPFDEQTCNLTLGSWTYNSGELDLTAQPDNPADLSSFIEHGEWDIYRMDPLNLTEAYSDGVSYSQVVFTIFLKRRPLFHLISLVLPSLIVQSLAIVGFLLPPECGEKLNLEITILLSLLVFQLVILESMPHTSENMPILAVYFVLAMILISMSCLCTIFVLKVHFSKHHKPPPRWVRKLLASKLGRLYRVDQLFISVHDQYQRLVAEYKASFGNMARQQQNPASAQPGLKRDSSARRSSALITRFTTSSRSPKILSGDNDDTVYGFYPSFSARSSQITSYRPPAGHENTNANLSRNFSNSFFSPSLSDFRFGESEPKPGDTPSVTLTRQILSHIEGMTAHQAKKRLSDLQESQWNIFAVFLDRVFLTLYLILGFGVALAVFLSIGLS